MREFYDFISSLIMNSKGEYNILGKLILSLFVVVIFTIIAKIVKSFFRRLIMRNRELQRSENKMRVETFTRLIANIINVVLYFFAIIAILDIIGVNTASIIATAGIGSVAIGFGCQSLVKDAVSGLFILFENQYAIGDYIKIEEFSGVVEDFTIRLTTIRDLNGDLHMIPNGTIPAVTNMSRGATVKLLKYTISYESDTDNAIMVLQKAMDGLRERMKELIVLGPTVQGISGLMNSGTEIQISVSTKSMDQWAVARAINKEVKKCLEEHNIEVPYSKIQLVSSV